MGNNEHMFLYALAAAAAALLFFAWRAWKKRTAARPAEEAEQAPVAVEGSTAYTGRHRGVKYWIYYDNAQARVEIEAGGEVTDPFMADRRESKPVFPGDARDEEVKALFILRALFVEAVSPGNLVAALFEERVLNLNAGTRFAPRPDEETVNKVADLLIGIRDKSRQPAADAPRA